MLSLAIKTIVRVLLGMDAEKWKFALNMVVGLAKDNSIDSNQSRANRFLAYFMTWYPNHKDWIVETLRNLVVLYARKKGLIEK